MVHVCITIPLEIQDLTCQHLVDWRGDIHFGQLIIAGRMVKPYLGTALEGYPDSHTRAHHAGHTAVVVLANMEGVLERGQKIPDSTILAQREAADSVSWYTHGTQNGNQTPGNDARVMQYKEKVSLGPH